jgi:hypothetical protein
MDTNSTNNVDTGTDDTSGDKWRELSRRAGERMERPAPLMRFSRPLMIFAAFALIVASVFHLI